MCSLFLSRKCFHGHLNTTILSQSQSVLKGQVGKGNSFGETSEFVALILKFLSGHTVPVGYQTGP